MKATKPERARTHQERLAGKEYIGDETRPPAQGGVAGGKLTEKIGTRDEEKRAFERPAGATRVRKSDEHE